MQLLDLVKPIEQSSDEELIARLKEIRKRRFMEKPAAKKRVERAKKKGAQTRISQTEKLLQSLTPEELHELLKQLGD